ncbi:hypothetical protein, partial [Paracoccus kondratievae]|uniref:hypothetical protein n=1 Tax=Paracoccus kondratievae TaxID=135740 RepID=UPI0022F253A2
VIRRLNDQTARISLQISSNVKKQRKQNNPNNTTSMAPSKPSGLLNFQTWRCFRAASSVRRSASPRR